ncbi:MAG: hypothetical protein JXQ30_07170 [Spirochaetes bacterium]|nr:hypothetical protein [Spirochaetota bacterium]
MQCPFFPGEEDFCLHDNCRYFDAGRGRCLYGAGIVTKPEQEPPPVGGGADTAIRKTVKSEGGFEYKDSTHASHIKETVHRENVKDVSADAPPHPRNMSAKEVWDRLKRYNEEKSIPGYDEIIESLIRVVNGTPGIHYLTPKKIDFWSSRVRGIGRYLTPAETVSG